MQVYICKCPCTFCWRTKNKLFAKASLRSNVTILSMIWQIINNRFRWRCSALWLDIIGVVFVIVYSGFSQVQNDKEVFCLPLHYFINRQRQNTFYDLAKWKNKRRATEINCLIEKKMDFLAWFFDEVNRIHGKTGFTWEPHYMRFGVKVTCSCICTFRNCKNKNFFVS